MKTVRPHRLRAAAALLVGSVLAAVAGPALPAAAQESGYRAVTGSGSTWSANMVEQWTADIRQAGISVSYSATGSSTGRREFGAGTVDFAVSEIPYGLTDAAGGFDKPPPRGFAYLPIVAGGTAFMYNLKVAGKPVTNLRLSGENTAKIFTGVITSWDDPALAADNPGIALPARKIVPVVRSDGSGTTAQFTAWMAKEHAGTWNAFCARTGLAAGGGCPLTSNFPSVPGFVSQSGSLGVAGYVATPTAEGAITYVEYSYALRARFPVAKILNSAGYYVEPDDQAVAVGLLSARINDNRGDRQSYLTQILDDVYRSTDRRSYPLSSYSYVIIPTAEGGTFKADKGRALGDWLYYSVCEGQQAAKVLGYSPLPQNLVRAGLDQIRLIPGVDVQNVDLAKCNNPTFSRDGTNTLAATAPQPPECDKAGPVQCTTGTAGAASTPTATTKGDPAAAAAAGGGLPEGGAAGAADSGTAGAGGAADAAATAGAAGTAGAEGTADAAGTAGAVPADAATGEAAAAGAAAAVAAAADASAGAALAAEPPGAVDPETGELLAVAGTGTSAPISGVAVAAPGSAGTALQTWSMVLAAIALLMATVGPALVRQRLAAKESS